MIDEASEFPATTNVVAVVVDHGQAPIDRPSIDLSGVQKAIATIADSFKDTFRAMAETLSRSLALIAKAIRSATQHLLSQDALRAIIDLVRKVAYRCPVALGRSLLHRAADELEQILRIKFAAAIRISSATGAPPGSTCSLTQLKATAGRSLRGPNTTRVLQRPRGMVLAA